MRIALLLGSDYTQGVKGVGIVNAMEIVEAFPGDKGLEELRDWCTRVGELRQNDMPNKHSNMVLWQLTRI